MNRYDDPVWRKACLQVDEAAALLESRRRGTEPFVWEAREKWAEAARRWIEGSGDINEVVEAANGFALSVEAATAHPHVRKSPPGGKRTPSGE